jgi:hypothetical protein
VSFLDGILEKQDPADRVRRALINDLELRRKDERAAARFFSYAYRGSADMILQHGRFFSGRAIPEKYVPLRGAPQNCFGNATLACEQDPELRYFLGVYTTGFGTPSLHAWAVAPDNGVVELTLPTLPDELAIAHSADLHMPFLAPEHWGYYGVQFRVELMRAYLKMTDGFPPFDRSYAEVAERHSEDYADRPGDDFPILKVPYDPNRTELPCRPTTK